MSFKKFGELALLPAFVLVLAGCGSAQGNRECGSSAARAGGTRSKIQMSCR